MNKFNWVISRLLLYVAGSALLMMVFLVVGNIVMRQVSSSFGGTTEMVGWLTAVVVSLSLAYSQLTKAHIELDLLVEHLPPPSAKRSLCLGLRRKFFILLHGGLEALGVWL